MEKLKKVIVKIANVKTNEADFKIAKTSIKEEYLYMHLYPVVPRPGPRVGPMRTLSSLRAQKDSFDTSIDRKMVVVEQLEIDQQKLRKNYKILLRNLYKLQLCKKEASPLFSSSSFNKRFQNWIYYRHLSKTRTVQSNYISKTSAITLTIFICLIFFTTIKFPNASSRI